MKINRLAYTVFLAVMMVNCTCANGTEYTPTRGANAGYTLKDTANTDMRVLIPTYDNQGNVTGTTTKFVDIKAKTYTKPGQSGNLTYSWDGHNLTVEPENLGIRDVINGKYIGNSIELVNNPAETVVSSVVGDFIGNNIGNNRLIYNRGTIESLVGNFVANTSNRNIVYNYIGNINSLTADFIGNSTDGSYGIVTNLGGTIGSIKGDFIGNSVNSISAMGAAITNEKVFDSSLRFGSIGSIEGNFFNNTANGTDDSPAYGGAIYSSQGEIGSIKGIFTGNSATGGGTTVTSGGAIFLDVDNSPTIEGTFIGNSATSTNQSPGSSGAQGGAIDVSGNIESIKGTFIGNSAEGISARGGAISNFGSVDSIEGTFIGNSASSSTENAFGGAICNGGTMVINDSDFQNNTAKKGGAIYSGGSSLQINAVNKDVVFRGNTAEEGAAIYNNNSSAPVKLNATGGNILFENNNTEGTILGTGTGIYSLGGLAMTASEGKKITINDAMQVYGTTSVNGGTVVLGKKAATTTFDTLNIAGDTTLDLQNYQSGDVITVGTLSGNGNLKLNADYDGSTGTMDKLTVNGGSGTITLNAIKILTDGDAASTDYIDGTGRNSVTVGSDAIVSSTNGYSYTFTPSGDNGHLSVTRLAVEGLDLATAITDATLGGSSYTMTSDYEFTRDAGPLGGTGRDFTIFGQGNWINGAEHSGIETTFGQALTIDNAVLYNFISSDGNGGALRAHGDSLTISDSVIGANMSYSNTPSAPVVGGGIFVTDGDLTLNDTDVVYNIAYGPNSFGGGIYGRNAKITINAVNRDVEITNNMAENGAAIHSIGALYPVELNATGGNILFENNNNTGDENGTGYGISSIGGLKMTASSDKKITINDAISISGVTSVNGGTVCLGEKAASTTFNTFDIAGDTTLDLQNAKAGDNLTVAALTGSGELKLNVDYNAATGAMDRMIVNGGSGKITLNAIKVLTDGTVASTDYLIGAARDNVTVITDAITSSTDGFRYTFTPNGAHGHLLVTREEVADLNLAIAITNATLGGTSYTMASDYTYATNAGNLGGLNRNFTIFGQNHVIDGGSNNGIQVTNGQTLSVENVSDFRNFTTALSNTGTLNINNVVFSNNTTDINNTGNLNLSGANTINTLRGNSGTTTLKDGTTIINTDIAQNIINMEGGTLKLAPLAGTTSVAALNVTGDSTLDLQNYYGRDTITVSNMSGTGELKLKTDYDAAAGTMDKIHVTNGSGRVTLNAIKILNDGTASSTDYLDGNARNSITVVTDAMVASTDGYKYTFTPSGNHGHLDVTRQYLGDMDLAHAISVADDGGGSYTMASDFGFTSDAGALDKSGRDFTIFGQNHTINGNDHNGIQISNGQTLSVENVTEYKNFTTALNNSGTLNVENVTFKDNTTDINNTANLNLSGTNTINTVTGADGKVLITGGKTTIAENGQVTQKSISLNGADLIVKNGANVQSEIIGMSPNRISNSGTIQKISGGFTGYSSTEDGGAVNNGATGTIQSVNAAFTGNSTTGKGGAIYNAGTIDSLAGSYTGNTAGTLGGAIYNSGRINIVADGSNTVFSGNTANGESNAIYQDGSLGNNAVINLNAGMNKSIIFADKVSGNDSGYNKININKSDVNSLTAGTVQFNNTVTNNDINLYGGKLQIGADYYLNGNNVTFNGGTFSMVNGAVGTANFNNLSITGDTRFNADVDLVNAQMDSLKADNYGPVVGNLIVEGLRIVNENAETKSATVPFVVDDAIKESVVLNTSSNAYSPIYMYKVGYDSTAGSFTFDRQNQYNPAAFIAPVGTQLGGYLNMLYSYDNAFANMDMNMMMTAKQRTAFKFANRYASAETPKVFSPTFMQQTQKGMWFRPYTSIESVGLKNGPKVDNIMYGMYVGGDSPLYSFKNGADVQYSAYLGYNGSHQSYGKNGIYQNGGMLGATAVLYKDDFFTALTANVGASLADASTVYGNEDFGMFTTGVASKSGYNWELADGKFIIQPSYTMSYSFIDTFNYTSAAGTKIHSSPLHALNISPAIKFIGNTEHGWQPYATFGMVWNLLDTTNFTANNVSLPSMSVKPYFQYGVGLQKLWDERSTGFVQVLMRNGGRNGVAFNLGYRYAFGK